MVYPNYFIFVDVHIVGTYHRKNDKMNKFGLRIFQFIMRPIQRLPLGFHYFWGRVFARMAKLIRYRRDVIIINIARSFPDKKYKEIVSIADAFYDHLGEIVAETFWFGGCHNNLKKLHDQRICEIEDFTPIAQSFQKSPSVMVLNSHFGNWEILGGLFQYIYKKPDVDFEMGPDDTCVVYKKVKSEFWDGFLGDNRCAVLKDYKGYQESSRILHYALEHKNQKLMYIFPTDQHPYKKAGSCEIPDFMHQKTTAMMGGAALACKLGMAVYNMAFDRKERGHYSIRFNCICEDASKMTPQEIMTEYYRILEEDINRNPSNYLWSHKRWK